MSGAARLERPAAEGSLWIPSFEEVAQCLVVPPAA